jgi:endo-1,4-beta-xylanase
MPSHRLSRREFLKIAGTAALGSALASCAPASLPTLTLAPTNTPTLSPSNSPSPTAKAIPTITPQPTATPIPNTLRGYADALGVKIGVMIDPRVLERAEVQKREFNLGLATWTWKDQMPEKDQFKPEWMDYLMSFGLSNGMQIRGMHLIFPQVSPDWLAKKILSKDEMIEVISDYITKVVTYCKGKVNQWTVVNEPYIFPYRQNDIFHRIIGAEYIDIAFQAARKADPSALLLYNDSDNHTSLGITTQLTKQIVERLKAKKLIDGVGLQMHLLGLNPPDKKDVIATMKSYGIPVYITEFDVNMKNVYGNQEERLITQSQIYKEMLEAALESGVCNSFSIWGVGDKYSWIETHKSYQHYSPNGDPTPFDDDLKPKPAYFAMLDVLKKRYEQRGTSATSTAKP